MNLQEYDEEDFDEFELGKPIEGFCFWVLTEFNLTHRAVRARKLEQEQTIEPNATATHPEAMRVAEKCADQIVKTFRGSKVHRVEPDMQLDEFHLYVIDRMNMPIAKIAVVAEDYRSETIH